MNQTVDSTDSVFVCHQVCVDSVESAFNAARGGASRLEVCSALSEGGLTPSPGLLTVISENVTIPCFAMIRPRPGDFIYSDMELLAMEKDICMMIEAGAKGLVFGCLDTKGDVDVKKVTRLVSVAKNKQSSIRKIEIFHLWFSKLILFSAA